MINKKTNVYINTNITLLNHNSLRCDKPVLMIVPRSEKSEKIRKNQKNRKNQKINIVVGFLNISANLIG